MAVGVQQQAQTRLGAEVVVLGGTTAAVAAAVAAAAAGRQVLLASLGVTLGEELTLALDGERLDWLGALAAPVLEQLAAAGGVHDGWVDPPILEMVLDRLLAEHGVEVLYYAVPLRLLTEVDRAVGVLCGGKDGFYVLSAGAVIDATPDGSLYRESGVAFEVPAELCGSRTVYLQGAGDDLAGLPVTAAGLELSLRRTWPNEACLTLTTKAPTAEELASKLRLGVAPGTAAARQRVPGLAGGFVTHTGHVPLLLTGPCLATPASAHPSLTNVFGAGPWMHSQDYDSATGRGPAGEAAGRAAADSAGTPGEVSCAIPDATVSETEVVVVGGGTGGALAAIASGRQGVHTTVVEAGWFLGGIGTGGAIHVYYHGVKGGIQDEVDERNRELAETLGGADKVVGFSPEAKKIVLAELALAAGVELRYGATVADVILDGNRVTGVVVVEPGRLTAVMAKAAVDASGDGDVVAQAGAEFILGRETDQLNHAYSQACGRIRNGKLSMDNFDAGYVDATDVLDLTRARRYGIGLYWKDEGWNADSRMLYMAPLLGLRQARHVVGDYTLTLDDQAHGRNFADSVAYGACHYDNHAFDYECESDEGMYWCWFLGHWRRMMRHGVPYGCLLPAGVDGVVVGSRALSVSHDAHMLFRMQRDMQRIGEAAGVAAALAAKHEVTPRALALDELQEALRANGTLLETWEHELAEATPSELVEALAGEDPTIAAWRLSQLGEQAVPALLEALESDDAYVRWMAAGALAMNGCPEAADLLIEALEQRDDQRPMRPELLQDRGHAQVRSEERWVAAIPLLGRLGDTAAVPALLGVLESAETKPDALVAAVRALGRIGDPAVVDGLEALLEREDLDLTASMQDSNTGQGRSPRDVSWQLELAAAEALGRLGHPAPDLAEPYLDDERAYVRRYAQRVLDEFPGGREMGSASEAPHLRTSR